MVKSDMRIKAVGYFITLLFFLGVCNGVLVRSKNYEKNKIEILKYAGRKIAPNHN